MEWALAIANLEKMSYLNNPWSESPIMSVSTLKSKLEQANGSPINFNRLYFGQEFCARSMPTLSQVREAVHAAKSLKLAFTFVTPYLSEEYMDKLVGNLDELQSSLPGAEVVINDWGVYYWLVQHFPQLQPVAGRLMSKLLRDPRIRLFHKDESPELNPLRLSGIASPYMRKLLQKGGVTRLELDGLPQGFDPGLGSWGYNLSLHLPFACITTGRMCLMGSWGLPTDKKFCATQITCHKACHTYWLTLVDHGHWIPDTQDWTIVQKGNTVFLAYKETFIQSQLSIAPSLGIDRVIYEPEPL